jgi:hypothetical protein
MKTIPFKKALKLWQATTTLQEDHLSESVLDGLLEGKSDDAVFAHLSLCNWCSQRLWKMQDSTLTHGQADDYVITLAAQVGIPQEATWVTADEKYKIEFRRIVSDKAERAVLVVRVQPPYDFTGKTIVVRDASERTILRGQIGEDGKTAGVVEDIESLVLKMITIIED